jgi:hypothetical protein
MKLESITVTPPNGDYWSAVAVFENDGVRVSKTVCARSQGCVYDSLYARLFGFWTAARDAERDFALVMFGDDWRRHVTTGVATEREIELSKQAQKMCSDLMPHRENWIKAL